MGSNSGILDYLRPLKYPLLAYGLLLCTIELGALSTGDSISRQVGDVAKAYKILFFGEELELPLKEFDLDKNNRLSQRELDGAISRGRLEIILK